MIRLTGVSDRETSRESERMWSGVESRSPRDPVIGVMVADREGIVTFADTVACGLLCLPTEDIWGHRLSDLLASDDDLKEAWKDAVLVRNPGSRLRVANHATGDNNVILLAHRDRVLPSDEMAEENRQFRDIVNHAPVGISYSDSHGVVQFHNQRLADMLGWNFEELQRMSWQDFTHPDDLSVEAPLYQQLMDGAIDRYCLEKRYVRKSGEILWVNVTVSRLEHGEDELRFIAAVEDISETKATEAALRESENRYRVLFNAVPDGIQLADTDGIIRLANEHAAQILGYASGEELIGKHLTDFIVADGRQRAQVNLQRRREEAAPGVVNVEYELIRADGTTFPADAEGALIFTEDGRPRGLTTVFRDISTRKRAERELGEVLIREQEATKQAQAAERRWRRIIRDSPEASVVLDLEGRVTMWNRSAERLFGWTEEEVLGTAGIFVPDEKRMEYAGICAELKQGRAISGREVRRRTKAGDALDLNLSAAPLESASGEIEGFVAIYVDVTERKRMERALQHQAMYDPLTDLPNRALLLDRLDRAIRVATRTQSTLSLLLMDLDQFKEINDTFGHHYGDLLLQDVGRRLLEQVRGSDTVCRLGGDEFAIVLPETDITGAKDVARKLLDALDRPFLLEDRTFTIGASIGIVTFPEHGNDVESLIRRADVAMYVAKRGRMGAAGYTGEQDAHSKTNLALMSDLRRAIHENQLLLHYQPKVHMKTGCAEHVEALVRWNHPTLGLVPPNDFIGLAEHMGLMKPLSEWVLNEALRQCRSWHDRGLDIEMAVNISPSILHDHRTADFVADRLAHWRCDPAWLHLEITESAVMAEPDRARDILERLHGMGVHVALDDFGTGHSALAYLKRLPIHTIKVDRSFVSEIISNDNDAFITRSIIDLAHNLGLQVIAEGVENEDMWCMLDALGCDMAQGYYISRPVPADEFEAWLKKRNTHPPLRG